MCDGLDAPSLTAERTQLQILQYKTKMKPKAKKTFEKMECTYEVGTGLTASTKK
jgi:hypothetical protein